MKHCFDNYALFQDMVECLFDEADRLLARMRTALAAGNAKELGVAAHRLKGTVVYLGAAPALDATRRVERMGLSAELTDADDAIRQLDEQIAALKQALAAHRKAAAPPTGG